MNCVSCDRVIDPRDLADTHCYGCGAHVCKLCTHVIIWEHEDDPVGDRHVEKAHRRQAERLGIPRLNPASAVRAEEGTSAARSGDTT